MQVMCCAPGCTREAAARGYCHPHYSQARSRGEIEPLPRRHVLSEIDRDTKTAVCSACGPTKVRIRGGAKGVSCMTLRKEERARRTPESVRRQQYKLGPASLDQMVEDQGGRCAICPRLLTDEAVPSGVDHDHACCPGKITCGKCTRGLLCRHCNLGLGYFKDDPALMESAIGYLARWTARAE